MKWQAIKEKAGTYELRRNEETFGGIYINGKNRGVGFVENAQENRYIFEFADGMFSKSVKVFANSKDNLLGEVKLGFTDNGTLELGGENYEWQKLGSSKIWLDSDKNIVLLLDLENNAETSPNVLVSDNLEARTKEILILCGWYLLVIEWRAGLTNANLAGMPVKSDEFKEENKPHDYGKDWIDVLLDATNL